MCDFQAWGQTYFGECASNSFDFWQMTIYLCYFSVFKHIHCHSCFHCVYLYMSQIGLCNCMSQIGWCYLCYRLDSVTLCYRLHGVTYVTDCFHCVYLYMSQIGLCNCMSQIGWCYLCYRLDSVTLCYRLHGVTYVTDWTVLLWVCCITFNLYWNVVRMKPSEQFERYRYSLGCQYLKPLIDQILSTN